MESAWAEDAIRSRWMALAVEIGLVKGFSVPRGQEREDDDGEKGRDRGNEQLGEAASNCSLRAFLGRSEGIISKGKREKGGSSGPQSVSGDWPSPYCHFPRWGASDASQRRNGPQPTPKTHATPHAA